MIAGTGSRVAELERNLAATVAENGKLRRQHADELSKRHALTADLHSRDLRIASLTEDVRHLHAEIDRLTAELATAKAVGSYVP